MAVAAYLTLKEYRDHVQFGLERFFQHDAELRQAQPVPHPSKPDRIVFSSGAMAGFFPLRVNGRKIGVKLFLREIPQLAERYRAIGPALRAANSPHLVQVEFRHGPRLGAVFGREHTPYLKMECVEGVSLKEHVMALVQAGNRQALHDLAKQWAQLMQALESLGWAHGDVQAENVMVEGGRLRLVDLDGMYVPALRGQCLECPVWGIPGWQHPRKSLKTFNAEMDRFPGIALYLTLLALAEDPSLFVATAVTEHQILFTREDWQTPERSSVLGRLRGLNNPEIRRLTELLVKATQLPADQTPKFSAAVDAEATTRQLVSKLERALRSGDERAIVEAWGEGGGFSRHQAAQAWRPQVLAAQQRLQCVDKFKEQHQRQPEDEDALWRLWRSGPNMDLCQCARTETLPTGQTVAERARLASQRLEAVAAVRQKIAAQQANLARGCLQEKEEQAIAQAWQQQHAVLASCKYAQAAVWPRVQEALQRLQAWAEFQASLNRNEDGPFAAAWSSRLLEQFAPALPHQARARLAVARMRALAEFEAQCRKDPEDDSRLWAVWTSAPEMDLSAEGARPLADLANLVPRDRARLAKSRLAALEELRRIIQHNGRAPLTEAGEKAIVELWSRHRALLGNSTGLASSGVRPRVQAAQNRLRAWASFQAALSSGDDQQLVEAWQCGGLADYGPAQPHEGSVPRALRRLAVLTELAQLLQKRPWDEAGVVEIWESGPDMESCSAARQASPQFGGKSALERIQLARKVLAVQAQIKAALSAKPPRSEVIAQVWEEALCRGHPLFEKLLPPIDAARGFHSRLNALKQALRAGDSQAVVSGWEDQLTGFLTLVEQRLAKQILAEQGSGDRLISPPKFMAVAKVGEVLRIHWTWRENLKLCLVAVADGRYPEAPAGNAGQSQGLVSRQQYNQVGWYEIPFGGRFPHVRIWPVTQFAGQPLYGARPFEARLASVAFSVKRTLWRKTWRLTLVSLSGPLELPDLIVLASEDGSGWSSLQKLARGPLEHARQLDLLLPEPLRSLQQLNFHVRPETGADAEWLRLEHLSTR
jgi:hypothetical protein